MCHKYNFILEAPSFVGMSRISFYFGSPIFSSRPKGWLSVLSCSYKTALSFLLAFPFSWSAFSIVTILCALYRSWMRLGYKSEGPGFGIPWGKLFVTIEVIIPAALGPGVYSASNRNEYQKQKYVSGEQSDGRWQRLTTSLPSLSRFSRRFELLNIAQHYRPPRLVAGDSITFLYSDNARTSQEIQLRASTACYRG
jgi:hypothetical protein